MADTHANRSLFEQDLKLLQGQEQLLASKKENIDYLNQRLKEMLDAYY